MSFKKVLITGGPVHAYIDPVKIVTNRFKGKRIESLAIELSQYANVTYLGSELIDINLPKQITVIKHKGIDDYISILRKISPDYDAVILGAAVANIIPTKTLSKKFNSHFYNVGDVFNLQFKIADRIIDEIRGIIGKEKLLVGFKLLSDVTKSELINAAKITLSSSNANFIIANDTNNLNKKIIVTPIGEFEMHEKFIANFISTTLYQKFYATKILDDSHKLKACSEIYEQDVKDIFNDSLYNVICTQNNVLRGSIALRIDDGFICSTRNKTKHDEICYVSRVDHSERVVFASSKATRAAPLFSKLFELKHINAIIHVHKIDNKYKILNYATPGTDIDVNRNISTSFNIEGHGVFYLLTKDGIVC